MKKVCFYSLFFIISIYSCSITLHIADIKRIIKDDKPMWIESWENDPLLNLTTDGWHSYKNNFSYTFTQIPDYEQLYFYSPSRNLFVDIYSRQLDIEINKSDTLIFFAGEPESEIVLSNVIRKTSDRLLFASDGAYFDDVIWIDDSHFIVLGHSIDFNSNENFPIIIIFDLQRQQQLFYTGEVNKILFDYVTKKFGKLMHN